MTKLLKKRSFMILLSTILLSFFAIYISSISKSYATTNTFGEKNTDSSKDLDIIAIDPDPCNNSVSGDAVLLVSDGYVMLMDTGHGTDGTNQIEYVSDYVINFLDNYQKTNTLKGFYIYLSHFHSDHYGIIYNSFSQNGSCSTKEGVGNRANSYTDVSGKFISRLKQTIGESKIKGVYLTDPAQIRNIYYGGNTSIWYYRNNYEYLTQTLCSGTTTTVENSSSGCTVQPVNLCKSGSKVNIVKKGDKILFGDAEIDIVGPNYVNTLSFSNNNYASVFDSAYPKCSNITTGKRNFKTTNNTCTINGNVRYDFSVENTGITEITSGHYFNDTSLVSLVKVGNTRYLATGDIEWQEIEKIVSNSASINPSGTPIDIMKVPHHAEKTGFLKSLYETYKPKFAFFQQDSPYYGGDDWSKYVIDYVSAQTNLLATGYNGTVKYSISNDIINISTDYTVASCTQKSNNVKPIVVNYVDSSTNSKIATSNSYIVTKNSLNETMTRTDNFYENETHNYQGKYNLKEIAPKEITGYTLKQDSNYDQLEGTATNNTTLSINLKYDINKYTVTFNSDGGSSVASQTVNYNGVVTKPANPTKEGYTFAGWTLNGTGYDFNTKITKNITLTATWTINKYTVTFDSDGGSSVASQTVVNNKTVTKPANPTKEGYIFDKWTLNGEEYNFNTKVTSNITLKATWKEINKTITIKYIDQNTGIIIKTKVIYIAEGEKIDINNHQDMIEDYKFVKVSLPENLEDYEDEIEVIMYYISTKDTNISIPNTLKKNGKFIIGFIIIIVGLILVSKELVKKNKE